MTEVGAGLFFRVSSPVLALILFGVILGTTFAGLALGRSLRHRVDTLREPFAALQAALLGVVGLILAFGLSLAVTRYEARRTNVVDDANAIGTTYLRAQTLQEPMRTRSLELLRRYADSAIGLSHAVPGSAAERRVVARGERLQRGLWRTAGQALDRAPVASAPRLYVESLNEMIDLQATRVAGRGNRVPGAVLALEVIGSALALGLLAVYLAIIGRGVLNVVLAAALVAMLLLVTFDLDRPTRGLVRVPSTPLTEVRESMNLPPPASGPRAP